MKKRTAKGKAGLVGLYCFLISIVLDFAIELMYRQSMTAVLSYIAMRPLAFLENACIVALFMSLILFTKRKWFSGVLIGALWVALGITNMFLLSYRVAPLSAIDFKIMEWDLSFVGLYMSVELFILLVIAIVCLLIGLVFLFKKSPKTKVYPQKSVVNLCVIVLTTAILPSLPLNIGFAGDDYKDVINMSEQYGFVYSFSRSIIDVGIDCPEDYSARRVHAIADEVFSTEEEQPEEMPNIIFLQLESFFDITHVKNFELSEDPVPYFRYLKENCSSGYFTAPSIGAGTANTEFEVISQMDVYMFGTGEYPFKTVLQEETCESVAYILKDMGLATHAMHDNTATFYDRNIAYANLGFDTFTSVEYMNDVEYNEIGWAKDKVLINEIDRAFNSTEERDLVYAISVQPHGAYPDNDTEREIKLISGIENESIHNKMEYYIEQINEVDDFLKELTDYLGTLDEPTVLVAYGDHLPSFDIDESMLEESTPYMTEYVIWANYPMAVEHRDLTAYQLASHVFDKIGINHGTLTKFHQKNSNRSAAYYTELLTLQYDMLYGDRVVYHGKSPYERVNMRFGIEDIVLNSATLRADVLTAHGENFTPYSVICINGEPQETEFISKTEIRCKPEVPSSEVRVSVKQIANDGTVLSTARVD